MLMPLASTSPFRSAVTGAGVGGKVSQRSTALAVGAERTRSNQETIQHIAHRRRRTTHARITPLRRPVLRARRNRARILSPSHASLRGRRFAGRWLLERLMEEEVRMYNKWGRLE